LAEPTTKREEKAPHHLLLQGRQLQVDLRAEKKIDDQSTAEERMGEEKRRQRTSNPVSNNDWH